MSDIKEITDGDKQNEVKGERAEKSKVATNLDKNSKTYIEGGKSNAFTYKNKEGESSQSRLAEKKLGEIRRAAAEGDKNAKGVLPKWEKHIKQDGKIYECGPAARGKTIKTENGDFKDWKVATRDAIKNDRNTPKEAKEHYAQQDSRIKKSLEERAERTKHPDTYAKNLLNDKDRLNDYYAKRNSEPPGYQLGHCPGDKLAAKLGRLENSDMNTNRGRKYKI